MPYDAIVIGGGLSGLSAAAGLASSRAHVLLLEQKPHLGGRTYSFVDEETGDVVDNGQHLLMGCYHETRRYLNLIGSAHLAELQDNLHIDFLHPHNGPASLHCPSLPPPLHMLAGLAGLSTVSPIHRLKLLRVGFDLQFRSAAGVDALASMTVDQWLDSLGQSRENKKYLWDIIAVGSLNDDPKDVSALLFYRVLRAAFLGSREDSCLLIPRVGLSELLANPAREFLEKAGSEVRLNAKVKSIISDGSLLRIADADGNEIEGRSVVVALPHHSWQDLKGVVELSGMPGEHLSRFESSPIITINLWLDRPVLQHQLVALLDSEVQWIFNKSALFGKESKGQYLSLVMSGAHDHVDLEREVLEALGMEELRRFLPAARNANVLSSLVIKEKRATFSPKPGVEAYRPSTRTKTPNLFLAGDWTNTGYPATIEGAVISGFNAAKEVKAYLDRNR